MPTKKKVVEKVKKEKVVKAPKKEGIVVNSSDILQVVDAMKKTLNNTEKYRFEVLVNDSHFKTSVDSLAEGIDQFIKSPDFPLAIKTKVILRFGKGDELTQKLWPTAIARRMFASMDVKPALIDFFGEQLTRRI